MNMPRDEWERKFKARIVDTLTGAGSLWTTEEAEMAANNELDGLWEEAFEDDPEHAADESLSYWDDDGE